GRVARQLLPPDRALRPPAPGNRARAAARGRAAPARARRDPRQRACRRPRSCGGRLLARCGLHARTAHGALSTPHRLRETPAPETPAHSTRNAVEGERIRNARVSENTARRRASGARSPRLTLCGLLVSQPRSARLGRE